jgi:hypothetical protein
MKTPRALSRAFYTYCRAQDAAAPPVDGIQHDPEAHAAALTELQAAEQRLEALSQQCPAALRRLALRHGLATARRQLRDAEREQGRAHRAERRVTQILADREYQLAMAELAPPGTERDRALARIPPAPIPAPDRSAIEDRIAQLQDRIDTLERNYDQEAR